MPATVLWPLDDHTRAKHRVLRAYLDAWIPIMAHQSLKMRPYAAGEPRLLLVDGFAGPGRYETGEDGSPVIMLKAVLEHRALPEFADVQFLFLFIEHDANRVAHLEGEIAALDLPANVLVSVEAGEFEATFGRIVDQVQSDGKQLVPTFAFIDPFGYSQASMSLAAKFLEFPRCETLVFLPLSHVSRFVGRAGQENAMTSLFGSNRWMEARDLSGPDRREFLLGLFEEELLARGQVKYVRSFAIRTRDGNDYRLVFATQHAKGLEVVKDAMWSVDPDEGTRYVATTTQGQEVLFPSLGAVNTRPLVEQLRASYGTKWFTLADAETVTLLETPFQPKRHLKRLTLAAAERDGALEVERAAGVRKGSFPDGIRMRFRT